MLPSRLAQKVAGTILNDFLAVSVNQLPQVRDHLPAHRTGPQFALPELAAMTDPIVGAITKMVAANHSISNLIVHQPNGWAADFDGGGRRREPAAIHKDCRRRAQPG